MPPRRIGLISYVCPRQLAYSVYVCAILRSATVPLMLRTFIGAPRTRIVSASPPRLNGQLNDRLVKCLPRLFAAWAIRTRVTGGAWGLSCSNASMGTFLLSENFPLLNWRFPAFFSSLYSFPPFVSNSVSPFIFFLCKPMAHDAFLYSAILRGRKS